MLQEISHRCVYRTHYQNYGGVVTYFKLYLGFWQTFKNFSGAKKILLIFVAIVTTPYWLLIKPLGCLWSIKTVYTAEYYDGRLAVFHRCRTWRFVLIPLFVRNTFLPTQDDLDFLAKKKERTK